MIQFPPPHITNEMAFALINLSVGETSKSLSYSRGRHDPDFINIRSDNPEMEANLTFRKFHDLILIHDCLDGTDYYIFVLGNQDEYPPGIEDYEHGFSYDYRVEWLLKRVYEPQLGGLYYRLYLFGWPKVTHSHT